MNTFKKPVFNKYWLPGFVFQSVIIGGGYGAGREVAEPVVAEPGVKILRLVNGESEFSFPDSPDFNAAELAVLYWDIGESHARNVVISRYGELECSPCGAGTGARMAYLYAMNKLKLDQVFIIEGVFDTRFEEQLTDTCSIGKYQVAVPQITRSATITGFHQFVQ